MMLVPYRQEIKLDVRMGLVKSRSLDCDTHVQVLDVCAIVGNCETVLVSFNLETCAYVVCFTLFQKTLRNNRGTEKVS